ncbi:hypothetical protein [Photobacterium lutimaris]|uniref:Lipoprotein n=1 Tax=Photobacterium lutimaris TaxID=388278 RepID=A0A2T3J084_9GAMM|nr:hypothetical protein [Photobacterium lutimaris]PSU34359.1 hypothetical protein C9I99_10295 [Photobacterium lutimaris]TDR75955.1 hypothetical protein DFP78_104318 [Photobacterium lutimaris]
MIRVALTAISTVFLVACGGSSSDSTKPTVDTMDDVSVRTIGIDKVNISGEDVDFYIKESNVSGILFDENNKTQSVSDSDSYYHKISWSSATPMTIDVGVQDTNTHIKESKSEDILLNNNEKLWAIAWSDNGETTLSTNVQNPASIEDKYRVRIFAVEDAWVQVVSTAVSSTEVKKGNFSSQMIISNCSGELYLGANQRDICDLDIGKSYLLIVDGENVLLAAEEKQ